MREIIDALSHPLWWLTAIGAGLVTTLIGAYAKGPIDSAIGAMSHGLRAIARKQSDHADAKVKELSLDETALVLASISAFHERVIALVWVAGSLSIMLLIGAEPPTGSTLVWFRILTWSAGFLGFIGVVGYARALISRSIVVEATTIRRNRILKGH